MNKAILLAVVLTRLPVQAQPGSNACARPAIGSIVPSPGELRSSGGKLRVDLALRTSLDIFGLTAYCYIGSTGDQAPTLRVKPGDELVLALRNELPPESPASAGHVHAAACAGGAMTKSSTNLHFHGLNVPPTCHQDEVIRTLIQPSAEPFEYRIHIPETQKPGLTGIIRIPTGSARARFSAEPPAL